MTIDWTSRFSKVAIVILTVAVALRIAWALLIPVVPVSDSFAYDTFANMLATHGVYGWKADEPSAYWPVGTSALYAPLYLMFGHNFVPIIILNIILSICIIAETIWLARLFFDDETAIASGATLAIWPGQIAYVTILASELPFIFFVLLGFCAWYNPRFSSLYRGVMGGLSFAAASYVRPVALLLPIVLWIITAVNFRRLRAQLPTMLIALMVMTISVTPWSVRNTRLFGKLTLLSTNGGVNLWMGNNSASNGGYMPQPDSVAGLNEYERDRQLGSIASQYIFDHPFSFIVRTIKKAVLLHYNETIPVHWNAGGIERRLGVSAILPLKVVMQTYWSGVLFLAIAGLLLLIRKLGIVATFTHPIVATWVYFTAVYSATVVEDRYHFSSHPFIAILSATALVSAARHYRWLPAGSVQLENEPSVAETI